MGNVFEPRNPDFAARVAASIASQPLMSRVFGTVVERVVPGEVQLAAAIGADVLQPHGNVHGVLASALADSAAGYAAQTLLAADLDVVTVEYKVNFLNAGYGQRLVARGWVLKPGRTLSICAADVHAEDGERRIHVAHMVATMMAVTA